MMQESPCADFRCPALKISVANPGMPERERELSGPGWRDTLLLGVVSTFLLFQVL